MIFRKSLKVNCKKKAKNLHFSNTRKDANTKKKRFSFGFYLIFRIFAIKDERTEGLSPCEICIMTIEELKSMMCIAADASKETITQTFERIAEVLMNGCVIKIQDEEYRILDFEFYYYNKNHQDISVHPRNSESLCWYFNDFGGIDLNFESRIEKESKCSLKYILSEKSYFGGILIRQIQSLSDNTIYDSPWKVAELFRVIDATSHEPNNPVLVIQQLKPIYLPKPQKRINLLGSKKDAKAKADSNLQMCFTEVSDSKRRELEIELDAFAGSPYRYCYKS